jgi:cellulose synthase/poly-beta-1,6-N-acetylglucosamine synthase-like glycosyltransferase
MVFISFVLISLAVLISIPVGVILLEVVAADVLLKRERLTPPDTDLRCRVAVLVPAHDESSGLLPTIRDIKSQLRGGDRLVVVADNCSDDTGQIAAESGAEVCARNDTDRIGKGYALDWGIKYLSTDPPSVVIIVDADCRLAEHAIDRLAVACVQTHRPVQALNLMTVLDEDIVSHRVAEFAWRVKNWARPLGLSAFNLPCQLMGTGMAFPWDVIQSAELSSGHIVEDLRLGLDLTLAGGPPLFCPAAVVTSHFPLSREAAISQRYRWEHGHLRTILATPGLIYLGIVRRQVNLIALTLDMAVPPLSLLVLLVIGTSMLAGLARLLGATPTALFISVANLSGLLVAILFAWRSFGRDVLPPHAIFSIASYVVGKLPLYLHAFSRRRTSQWVRTDRKKPPKVS